MDFGPRMNRRGFLNLCAMVAGIQAVKPLLDLLPVAETADDVPEEVVVTVNDYTISLEHFSSCHIRYLISAAANSPVSAGYRDVPDYFPEPSWGKVWAIELWLNSVNKEAAQPIVARMLAPGPSTLSIRYKELELRAETWAVPTRGAVGRPWGGGDHAIEFSIARSWMVNHAA